MCGTYGHLTLHTAITASASEAVGDFHNIVVSHGADKVGRPLWQIDGMSCFKNPPALDFNALPCGVQSIAAAFYREASHANLFINYLVHPAAPLPDCQDIAHFAYNSHVDIETRA